MHAHKKIHANAEIAACIILCMQCHWAQLNAEYYNIESMITLLLFLKTISSHSICYYLWVI